jgi:Notch-like protein
VPVPCDDGGTVCMGTTKCVGGTVQCDGSPIVQESCNCLDDDCDGKVDEGSLCPSGASCTNCQCAFACAGGEFPCPLGKACVGGFCIADPCFGVTCPNLPDGTVEECVNVNNLGTCKSVCSQNTCASPLICVPQTGQCAPNDCTTFPSMCQANEQCVNGACVANPCAGVTCPNEQYCELGQCFGSCAGVTCPTGQRCRLGTCQTDPCGKDCPAPQVCDTPSGTCVADPCGAVHCPTGKACDPENGGQCIDDPCRGITCPHPGEVCRGGTCFDPSQFLPDAGTEVQVTAAGGGGCNAGGGNAGWLVLAALLVLRRRRS